jgi:hypothetical protein
MLANRVHNIDGNGSVAEIVHFVLDRANAASKPRPQTVESRTVEAQALKSEPWSEMGLPESEILKQPLYDTTVIKTNKASARESFFDLVQEHAAKPIVLRELIRVLIGKYAPPRSKKNPEMVIRVRTRDAYTKLGYLRKV